MANQAIEWDVEKLIGKLDILQKVQIPYAASVALKRYGYMFAKQQVVRDMQDVFRQPVPLTLNAVLSDAKGMELTIRVKDSVPKGNAPGKYLYPVSTEDSRTGQPIYETRFTKGLRKKGVIDGSYWPVPFLNGRGVRTNAYGRMSPGQYQQVLAGLEKGIGSDGYRYFSVPDLRKTRQTTSLSPGVYRVKGRNDVQLLFNYARTQPRVPSIFDLRQYALDYATEILPSLLSNALRQALNR